MRIKKHLFLVEGPDGGLRLRCHQDPAWHADIQVLDVHDPNDPNAHVTAKADPGAQTSTDPEGVQELTAKDVADAADAMGMGEPELDGMTPAEPVPDGDEPLEPAG